MNESSNKSESRSTAPTRSGEAANTSQDRRRTLTEAEFLRRQATDARRAMSRSLELLKQDVVQSVNPVALQRNHPWATMAGVAAGGFLLVALVGRPASWRRRRKDPLKELDERIHAFKQRLNIALSDEEVADKPPRKAGLSKGLMYHALRMLRPIIINTITG